MLLLRELPGLLSDSPRTRTPRRGVALTSQKESAAGSRDVVPFACTIELKSTAWESHVAGT